MVRGGGWLPQRAAGMPGCRGDPGGGLQAASGGSPLWRQAEGLQGGRIAVGRVSPCSRITVGQTGQIGRCTDCRETIGEGPQAGRGPPGQVGIFRQAVVHSLRRAELVWQRILHGPSPHTARAQSPFCNPASPHTSRPSHAPHSARHESVSLQEWPHQVSLSTCPALRAGLAA